MPYLNNSVHIHELSMHEGEIVDLWRVHGIHGRLYPTKLTAEVAARVVFPDEHILSREERISFVSYVRQT